MPAQVEKKDAKITRITSQNKFYFQKLMSADMYYAVELEDCYTLAAFFELPDPVLSSEIDATGVLQFATDGTKGKYSQAKILEFSVTDGEKGDEAWELLLSEMLQICREAGIFTVNVECFPADTDYIDRLKESGFSFSTARKKIIYFSLDILNRKWKGIFTSKIPTSYAQLEIVSLDKLSPRQYKSFVRKLSETRDWDARKLIGDLKRPNGLKSYIAMKDNAPAGAILLDCENDYESDIAVASIKYMRTFQSDAYCLLLLCKIAIADLVKSYGKNIFFSAETTYMPGVKLIQKIWPELNTISLECGTLDVPHEKRTGGQ